jgi:hypothetical protein
MRRPAKTETIRRRKGEQRRHDIARTAWSDETMSVVQRLQAGLADLRSRLEAERFRLKSRSPLSFHLRKRIKATRDLIRLLEAERATMKDDAENRDRAPRASLNDESGDDEETEPRASMSAGESRRYRLCISAGQASRWRYGLRREGGERPGRPPASVCGAWRAAGGLRRVVSLGKAPTELDADDEIGPPVPLPPGKGVVRDDRSFSNFVVADRPLRSCGVRRFSHGQRQPDLVRPLTTVNKSRRAPVVLSQEEVARLLEAAPGLKYKAALSVAYGAGLRVSEVANLKVSDVDSERMTLRVEQSTSPLSTFGSAMPPSNAG